jgi:hypothetical protein
MRGFLFYLLRPDPEPVGVSVEPLGEALGPRVFPDGLWVLFGEVTVVPALPVAPDTRRLSIVRDCDKPCVDRAQERHVGRYQDVTTAAIHALARPGGVRGVRR